VSESHVAKKLCACFVAVLAMGMASTAQAQVAASDAAPNVPPNAAPNQWFTGSLEAPSPALPVAGMLALEPYLVFQSNTGDYNDHGVHQTVSNDTSSVYTLMVIKYGLTSRLTFEALPMVSHAWAGDTPPTGASFGDLPMELEYRVLDTNYHTGAPSVTFDLGVTAPTGAYDRLNKTLDGVGAGDWSMKEGVVLQSLFDTWHNHPVRLRAWAEAFEPLNDPSVSGSSVYGTPIGFHGRVTPGTSGQIGIAGGYALDQRWVLALDLVDTYGNGFRLSGSDITSLAVPAHGPTQNNIALAPAVEYNWSADAGLIFGIEFSVAGRNTPSYVAPQIAVAWSF
jgi:hypothetical protein